MPSRSRKFSQSEVEAWSLDGVKEWLISVKLESCTEEFLEQNVDGSALLNLTLEDIKGMVHGDKQIKAMKKALSTLPGNSMSKKETKGKKKKPSPKNAPKRSRGPLPAEPGAPPLPPEHPASPGLPTGPPPPVPSGHSRPTFQRLGPPIPTTPRPTYEDEQEVYDDPGAGYDGGPDDVYDSVDPDDIADISNSMSSPPLPPQGHSPSFVPPSPTFAPPPPGAPPGAEAYGDEDDQPIYDMDDGEESYDDEDDSFDSDSDPDEDYEEPYEEEQNSVQQTGSVGARSRLASDANIRSVMGKFYAFGVLKDQASQLVSSSHAPPPSGPPPEDQIIEEDDIYDSVPDEVKDMMLGAGGEEGIDEDIYDLPPEQEELQAFKAPSMRPPIANTAPPPPGAPPPDNIIEEDVYDIPAEVIEESQQNVPGVQIYRPAAPLPPGNQQELPPGRPPKGSPSLPAKQPFNKPAMRSPILGPKAPAAPPPSDEPPPSRPPKPEAAKPPPPPPLPEDEAPKINGFSNRPKLRAPMDRRQGGGPPPRPSANTKPQASPNMEQRNLADTITDTLARLSPAVKKHPPPQPTSPEQSPRSSPTFNRKPESPDLPPTSAPPPPPGPAMKHNLKPVPKYSQTPPNTRKHGTPPLPSKSEPEKTPEPAKSETPVMQRMANITKPPVAQKSSKLADRMKMFETNTGNNAAGPSLKPPPKPPADESPMSGRKMDRKANVSDLTNKFGGRVTSPVSDRSSPSPEGRPNLPPKPSGAGSGRSSPNLPRKSSSPPLLPSKPAEPSSPTFNRKQWPPTKEESRTPSSPLTKRKFEAPPKEESLPPKRDSPSFRRKCPPPGDSNEEPEKQEKKPFVYKSYKPPTKEPDPIPSLPPRETEPSPSLPPRPGPGGNSPALPPRTQESIPPRVPQGNSPALPPRSQESVPPRGPPGKSPSLPPRSQEPRVPLPDPTPSLPPRIPESGPTFPPRIPEPSEPPPPQMPDRPRPGPSHTPAPSLIGGPPRLPDRPPPTGAPKLPDRNPPQRPPFSPPAEPSLPPRPAQQAFPPLPNRPPPKEPPPPENTFVPPRPSKSAPYGSPIGMSWYHGNLDRKRSEAKLKHYTKDGTFIIRDSSKIQGEYSLSLLHSGGIRHLRIRLREDKKFVLGEEKADELAFDTVIALVEYHKKEPLHLKSGGDTVLRYECPH